MILNNSCVHTVGLNKTDGFHTGNGELQGTKGTGEELKAGLRRSRNDSNKISKM